MALSSVALILFIFNMDLSSQSAELTTSCFNTQSLCDVIKVLPDDESKWMLDYVPPTAVKPDIPQSRCWDIMNCNGVNGTKLIVYVTQLPVCTDDKGNQLLLYNQSGVRYIEAVCVTRGFSVNLTLQTTEAFLRVKYTVTSTSDSRDARFTLTIASDIPKTAKNDSGSGSSPGSTEPSGRVTTITLAVLVPCGAVLLVVICIVFLFTRSHNTYHHPSPGTSFPLTTAYA